MPMPFDELIQSARDWAQRAVDDHWLQPSDLRELTALESRSPAELFEPGSHRPLVAAFFGGTGVGKSSLLNRLAGQSVARTGVERPTSREVSVYLHDSVSTSGLPRHFPMEQIRIAQHRDETARQVMWVDMPDIDSVEQHNRALVLKWLPHIDVLIYVVSPERYRDDKGWRLLREHGGDHAWLFVLNQWDRGQPVQLEDFRRLLGTAGFQDPVVLRTDCRPLAAERREDDFAALQRLLRDIATQHVMSQLEQRAEHARLTGLQTALRTAMGRLGRKEGYASLQAEWAGIWSAAEQGLLAGLEWPMQTAVAIFTGREANPLSRSLDLTQAPKPAPAPGEPRPLLWDDWAESRLQDAVRELLVAAGNQGLPVLPLKTALEPCALDAGRRVLSQGQLMLRQALARPGNGAQRIALKLAGLLSILLPLGAMGWAAYQVVKGYYDSAMQHLDYLGADFAIHSLLLIGLSWLLPWFACTRLKPSVEKSALKGLRSGVTAALAATAAGIAEALITTDTRRAAVLAEGQALLEECAAPLASATEESGLLGRLLPGQVLKNPEAPS